jgi:hypothetical protein
MNDGIFCLGRFAMTLSSDSLPNSLAVRNHSLSTAFSLLMQSLPYALARFGILIAASFICIVYAIITIGGAAWLGTHIAQAFGWVWFIGCASAAFWAWTTLLRYGFHLLACGHVAVLTELIVRGSIGNGSESMLTYGRRIVTERFGQVNALFGMNLLIRGILNMFHRTLDWAAELLPIPGLESIANLVTAVLRASTRYMDKVIFSYNLARGVENPWDGARDGIVYYSQNAKEILKTSVWIVILEKVLTVVVWIIMLVPAAAITTMLPHAMREAGGLVSVLIAVLFALAARAAFVKPLFLTMIMVRFHALIEHQVPNPEWVAYLSQVSDKFREIAEKAQGVFTSGHVAEPPRPATP